MTELPPADVIDEARRRNDIPDDWPYAMCSNACGELVFYPPDGAGAIIVCTPACAKQLLAKIGPEDRLH